MRTFYSSLFFLLIAVLAICAHYAFRSQKSFRYSTGVLLCFLIPPLIGNLIVTVTGNRISADIGYYIYFISMDFVMFSLLRFTLQYCNYEWPNNAVRILVLAVLGLDILLFLLNPLIHMSFTTEAIIVDGYNYYRVVPFIGQTIHRIIDYLIYFAVLILFTVKTFQASRINAERYYIILAVMILTGLVQTYFIFSRSPIDRSMIGYGIFGVLVFYFALYYRPMRLLDSMLSNVASGMDEALFFFDSSDRCIWANEPGRQLTGIKDEVYENAGDTITLMFPDINLAEEEWNKRQVTHDNGVMKSYVLQRHAVTDELGRSAGSFLSIRDNTEDQALLEREQYLARHDRLTGLYTREFLSSRIEETLRKDLNTEYYIVFVNIREFKIINDIFGADFGDYTLLVVSDWIRKHFTGIGIFGRLSGDTFGICVPKDAFDEEILESSLDNFVIQKGSISHSVLIHLGVYEVEERDIGVSVMFDRAHMALALIRGQYAKHIAYYDHDMRRQTLWNQQVSAQLHHAIRERQIQPYLQAIVDRNGAVVGAEALVRWIHPSEGVLSPNQFVPVFEANGMISELDRYMWRSVCEILSRWKQEGKDRFISVNISPVDFYYMDVAGELNRLIEEFDIDPKNLRIEITESVMMANEESRMRILSDLRQQGFFVEIDDFGSGYSSLNLLKDMPADLLKIDMVFLHKSKSTAKAKIIVSNIIRMSHDLNIVPLTEGVETEQQFRTLSGMGCELFQGYYFSKPLPVDEFEQVLLKN